MHWEYWPFNVIYGPIYIYWFLLCIRTRSLFFFNTSNPTIKNGGFLLESKKEIYDIIPHDYYPKTLFFKAGADEKILVHAFQSAELKFPLAGKPDIGGRGMGVKKLNTITEVTEYAKKSKVDFLLQQFVLYENEVGIFYYRYPGEMHGKISGIVGKEFLTVVGDGVSTIEELLRQNKRFILQIAALKKTHNDELNKVLKKDERHLLVPYGNHARGAKFVDLSHLADDKLVQTIDNLCKEIPGFYFGRMDIRFRSWDELKQGKNFSIIELNGAGSEPTHIYDPKHSIFFAWKEIIRHWKILNRISLLNHRSKKIPFMGFSSGMKMLRENSAYVKLISDNNI